MSLLPASRTMARVFGLQAAASLSEISESCPAVASLAAGTDRELPVLSEAWPLPRRGPRARCSASVATLMFGGSESGRSRCHSHSRVTGRPTDNSANAGRGPEQRIDASMSVPTIPGELSRTASPHAAATLEQRFLQVTLLLWVCVARLLPESETASKWETSSAGAGFCRQSRNGGGELDPLFRPFPD